MEIKGLNKLQRKLEDLGKRAHDLDGTHNLTFAELFPDHFVKAHSSFPSMQEMVDAGGIQNPGDIQTEAWDDFVSNNTTFDGWEAMKSAAGAEWTRRKLGL